MKCVLLVEPDEQLARLYQQVLSAEGYQVRKHSTAQGAIYDADTHRPDVVIVELQLVSHSGLEFLYEFRSYSDWQRIPVIVHTLIPPEEFHESQRLLFDELNVSIYLYKPRTSLRVLLRHTYSYLHASAA